MQNLLSVGIRVEMNAGMTRLRQTAAHACVREG